MTSNDTSAFAWTDAYLLGYAPMDHVHHEFVTLLDAVLRAADHELAQCLDAFASHTEAHFANENRWMAETDFPGRECHINEHEAVLKSVREVQALVAAGNYAIGRDLAQHLAEWFPPHTDHLDSALSHWLCKRSLGGKPVVLRRNVLPAATGD